MAKMTGLGKGLDALFGDTSIDDEEIEQIKRELKDGEELVQKIKVIEIEPNKNQPRRVFNNESIVELSESIKRYGIIQPIIVTKKDNYYEIVAGERRWRASKKAGLTEIPCIVRQDEEKKNKEIALIENIQREDLNPIEKARSFRELMDEYGMTQQQLSETIGISRSALANTVRLLNLDERVIDLTLQGKLTEGHCRSLMCFEDKDKQYEAAIQIIEKGETVRDIERKVKNKKKTQKVEKKYDAIFKDIENSFQGFFGTKVKLDAGKRSGKIIIQYTSNEDLERILDIIGQK
ncbi:MAG TPA: ParB/RepB/Spo0J family partition protein [Clostridia bacterium]|nr:ParB/RepB/Spo0J family partition protein [Clostridia bacterium]